MDIAVKTKDLTKCYKIYNKPSDRLKESLDPFRKKYHRDFFALNNVCFNVKRGETVGIIGKNGSGKSTLLKLITGVLTPTDGNIIVNDEVKKIMKELNDIYQLAPTTETDGDVSELLDNIVTISE